MPGNTAKQAADSLSHIRRVVSSEDETIRLPSWDQYYEERLAYQNK
jgi:hypothetical protein